MYIYIWRLGKAIEDAAGIDFTFQLKKNVLEGCKLKVYVCMYVCMYIYICICMYIYIYTALRKSHRERDRPPLRVSTEEIMC